jgi:hypothetical protein
MILNSTKCGRNRTKDVEVGPERRTDGQTDRPILIYPSKLSLRGYNNIFLFVIVISLYPYVMHCRFENKRIYKGMQFDGIKKIAVSDSGQSLVNVIFFFKVFNLIWT